MWRQQVIDINIVQGKLRPWLCPTNVSRVKVNAMGLGWARECCVDAGPWHGFRRFLSLHKKKKIFVNYSMFCLSGHSCLVGRWLTAYRQLHTVHCAMLHQMCSIICFV